MQEYEIETLFIDQKPIYRFEDHATAILPWADMITNLESPPLLITFDHHTDTNSAWLRSFFRQVGRDLPKMNALREERISKINPQNKTDLLLGMEDLHHDEHIDLAVRLGFFSGVVVIQHSSPTPLREWEDRGMTVLPFDAEHLENPSTQRRFFDLALEDEWLKPLLDNLPSHLSPWEQPTILDIDLDYFKTKQGLSPKNAVTFNKLVKTCLGITVAEEAGWVERLWLDKTPQEGELFNALFRLIKEASG